MELMRVIACALLVFGLTTSSAVVAAETGTLEKIRQTQIITLGYRENSPPFSFVSPQGKPVGYSVELCEHVVRQIADQLKLPNLKTQWLAVSARSRFDVLRTGEIDLVCGNTTHTLSRRAEFDFSLMTFLDGTSLLYRSGQVPESIENFSNQRFAVVSGTTTEKVLDKLVAASRLGARLIRVTDHDAAMIALKEGVATAYAADRTVLIMSAMAHGAGGAYELSSVQFNYEPYALMMRRDADFRLAVDRALVQLYRSHQIDSMLNRWFAPLGPLSEAVELMTQLYALPE